MIQNRKRFPQERLINSIWLLSVVRRAEGERGRRQLGSTTWCNILIPTSPGTSHPALEVATKFHSSFHNTRRAAASAFVSKSLNHYTDGLFFFHKSMQCLFSISINDSIGAFIREMGEGRGRDYCACFAKFCWQPYLAHFIPCNRWARFCRYPLSWAK